jgi:leucyl-tRNA synthetase
MAEMIDFAKIERKWQKRWEAKKIFESKDSGKNKYYVLEMYPYPSASGLHMGHAFNYSIGDIQARLRRMQGFNVLYPMGFDSFGLPAENAAIKAKLHPKKFTEDAIANYIRQMKELGLSYDWSRILMSHDPEFYKWNQYFFIQFFKRGLAYRKKSSVNWCSKCNTVLANEQVKNGKCWRHEDYEVQIKQLEQWFLKTTEYAEELLKDIEKLDWPERIKAMQRNWIGKSEGTEIIFDIEGKKWKVFTTRPDTLYGVTFLVTSAQHPRLMDIVKEDHKSRVQDFLRKLRSTKQEDMDKLDKEGVFTGSYAEHPLTGEKIPIWTGNFVVAEYGSGMVMAVPAHDQRDFEFAKKYGLTVKRVIKNKENVGATSNEMKEPYIGQGNLQNSEGFDGLQNREAKNHITKALEKKRLGKKKTEYKLRDWLISRQRYWGTPIPMIYCDSCGVLPELEKNLPVKLPERVRFGEGNPLEGSKSFVETKCLNCGKKARRETDTMDTFFDSSWYFLRYCDPENQRFSGPVTFRNKRKITGSKNIKKPFDTRKIRYWMPVERYIGGAEHAVMHLIYARFFTKVLRDLKILGSKIDEPFPKLFNQGMLHKNGFVMSKSRGNVVLPGEVSKKYGIDTARLFLVSIASPDKDLEWSDSGIDGSLKFVLQVIEFVKNFAGSSTRPPTRKWGKISKLQESRLNKTIRDYTFDLENFRYNLAVIKLRELFDVLKEGCDKKSLGIFLKLLAPICPHVAEELWSKLENKEFISLEKWPNFDKKKINERLEEEMGRVENVVGDIRNILKIIGDKGKSRKVATTRVYLYVLPQEKKVYDSKKLSDRLGLEVEVLAVNDKKKYDPESKSKKVKPGRPGIYVE